MKGSAPMPDAAKWQHLENAFARLSRLEADLPSLRPDRLPLALFPEAPALDEVERRHLADLARENEVLRSELRGAHDAGASHAREASESSAAAEAARHDLRDAREALDAERQALAALQQHHRVVMVSRVKGFGVEGLEAGSASAASAVPLSLGTLEPPPDLALVG